MRSIHIRAIYWIYSESQWKHQPTGLRDSVDDGGMTIGTGDYVNFNLVKI